MTVCRSVWKGQLYLVLHRNGNDSHMYLLGSLTVLWNRSGKSEDYSVSFSVSYVSFRAIAKWREISGWSIWRHKKFLQRTLFNHFLLIPSLLWLWLLQSPIRWVLKIKLCSITWAGLLLFSSCSDKMNNTSMKLPAEPGLVKHPEMHPLHISWHLHRIAKNCNSAASGHSKVFICRK